MKLFSLLCLALNIIVNFNQNALAIPEKDYAQTYLKEVLPFFATGTQFKFEGFDGTPLAAIRFIHPAPSRGVVVVLQGRSETYLKYAEVFYDLYQKGFSIYSFDDRGQGLSYHLSGKNTEIGDIEFFQNYEDDFYDFMKQIVLAETPHENHFLLGHSLGGALATHYLAQNPGIFQRAVLSAPMFSINTHPYPEPIALQLAKLLTRFGKGQDYAPGRGDYNPKLPLKKSDVTHSAERFWMWKEMNHRYPESIIGGPSNRWVVQALLASHEIRTEMKNITTPVLLFQAGKDQIVRSKAENESCHETAFCSLIHFPDSGHEILMEKDQVRSIALEWIDRFFRL